MATIADLPTSATLKAELQRKMLLLLAGMSLVVGLVTSYLAIKTLHLPRFPYASAALVLVSCTFLLISRVTDRFNKVLLDSMNVGVFLVCTYTVLHQNGIYSASLWLLSIPIAFSVFSGSFRIGTALTVAFMAEVIWLYFAGPKSIGRVSMTSVEHPDLQMLFSILVSTLSVAIFIGLTVRWVGRVEEALTKSRQVAEQALAMKSLFFAQVTHEIRTPLNGMLGATELLQSQSTPEWQRQQLMSVQAHSARMLQALVNDILDYSKLEAGELRLSSTSFRPRRLVFETTELFSVQAFDKGLELTCSREPNVPQYVIGDEHHLRQVVTNLVSNAVKFTTTGGVHLHLSVGTPQVEDDVRTVRLKLEVSDTGRGIPKEKQATLFTAYSQTDANVSRVYGGTGLGLNICNELVQLMGGTIELDSAAGSGSRFIVTVPVQRDSDAEEADYRQFDASGVRVLLATASDGLRRHMQTHFHDLGIASTHTSTMPDVGTATRMRATVVFVDAPLLSSTSDAKKRLDDLASEGVRVALLAPLGSDVMIGAAAGTTLLYKPVRRTSIRDLVAGAPIDAHVTLSGGTAPHSSTAPAPQPTPGVAPAADPRGAEPTANTPWLTVLIADDSPVNQVVAQAMLGNLNCRSIIVHNGVEAVEALEHEAIDVVLMDVQMPVLDGIGATERIRGREQAQGTGRVPIVAMTGNNETSDVSRYLEVGMDRFLSKPFGLAQLRRTLETVTAGRTSTDEPTTTS